MKHKLAVLLAALLCAGAFVIALVLPAREGAGGPLLLGLPVRTATVLYAVGVALVAVLGKLLFNAPVPPLAMVGMVLIVGGVALVSFSGAPGH